MSRRPVLPHQCPLLLGDEHLVGGLDAEGVVPGVDHRQGGIHAEDVGGVDIAVDAVGQELIRDVAGPGSKNGGCRMATGKLAVELRQHSRVHPSVAT